MRKELEALEKFLDDYLTLCEKLHTNRQEKMLLDKNSPYNVLKTYLEFINNADSSEALKSLDYLYNSKTFKYNDDWECFREHYDAIKDTILGVQKEHNSVNLLMQELNCKDFEELRKYARCGYEKLNKK